MKKNLPFIILCLLFACKKEENNFNPDQNITYTSYYKLGSGQDTVYTFYIPSGFSPDGNGINDVFNGRGVGISGLKLSVFNKWGDLGYFTDDSYNGWDGHFNRGKDIAPPGMYWYRFEVTDLFGELHTYAGQVALFR